MQEIIIRFEDLSSAEASVEALRLQETLKNASPYIGVKLRRESAETMDLGTTLVVILGPPAIIAAAKGVAAWLGQRGMRPGSLVVERVGIDGSIERLRFDGNSADAAKVAEAFCSPGSGAAKL